MKREGGEGLAAAFIKSACNMYNLSHSLTQSNQTVHFVAYSHTILGYDLGSSAN